MAKYLACIKTSTRHGCKWGFQNMIFELIIEEEKKIFFKKQKLDSKKQNKYAIIWMRKEK